MSCSGNCGSCKGSCGSGSKKATGPGSYVKEDISVYLAPEPKPKSDKTPLDQRCKCYDGLNVKRWACLPCIRSWVQATHCYCEIKREIKKYKKISEIAAERIEICMNEKKLKERIGEHKCNCKSKDKKEK